ncbi:DUF4382 domain-containing protein [Algoriphagus aquatilis]|uniref:DUF4382 domain-containing protein n=1 Tax=Algoriphagus aquatilis TaxID=490186 RepID=A0ABW0BVN1_9BACT
MNRLKIFLFLLGIGLFGMGCEGPDNSPKALVNVLLVDAPAKWDSVVVEIQGVEIDFVQSGRQGEIQKIWMPYEPAKKSINLTRLVNGNALTVSRKEFQLGQITAVTLKLGTSHALYQGDTRYPLTLPSDITDYSQDLKVDLEAGISYDLVLDFDLEKSIRVTQASPLKLAYNPTIQAYTSIGRSELNGIVFPTELKPAIYAISENDSLSTHTNSGGAFLFKLSPGRYTLYIDPKDNRFVADTLINVEVKSDQRTTLDRITLSRR